MRFNIGAQDSPITITSLDLFNLLLVGAGGNMGYPIVAALRLRKVRLFAVQQTIGTSAYVSVEFSISNTPGNVGVKPTVYSDTSLSTAIPAQIAQKPPPHSACSMWQYRPSEGATGGTAFILGCTHNAVVDVIIDYVLQNGEIPPTPITVTSNAGEGVVFLNTLNNTTDNSIVPSPEYADGN